MGLCVTLPVNARFKIMIINEKMNGNISPRFSLVVFIWKSCIPVPPFVDIGFNYLFSFFSNGLDLTSVSFLALLLKFESVGFFCNRIQYRGSWCIYCCCRKWFCLSTYRTQGEALSVIDYNTM